MGCAQSKDRDLAESLKKVEAAAEKWREKRAAPDRRSQVPDLGQLEKVIDQLSALHEKSVVLREGTAECKQVRDLGSKLCKDIVGMLDTRSMRRKDFVKSLVGLAEKLESAGVEGACTEVREKHKQCLTEQLGKAESKLQEAAGLALLPLEEVLNILKEIKVRDAPELAPRLLECCRVLAGKTESAINKSSVSDNVKKLQSAWDFCKTVDDMGSELVTLLGDQQSSWERLLPKVQKVAKTLAERMLPERLEALEAEVVKQDVKRDALIGCLQTIVVLWIEPSLSQQGRLENCLFHIEQRIREEFEQATKSRQDKEQDDLIKLAKNFDHQCRAMQSNLAQVDSKSRVPLKKELEKKKARQTLKVLMPEIDEFVSTQKRRLRKRSAEVFVQLKKEDRDKLKMVFESAKWSFKLAKGSKAEYEEYAAEKSEEVEAAYLKWNQGGCSTVLAERTKEIAILVDAALVDRRRTGHRERCKYGEKGCWHKNKPEHTAQFCHPGDRDWERADMPPVPSGSLRAEIYILDFQLMTQCRKGPQKKMRNIIRVEGRTLAQKHTQEYYEEVVSFLQKVNEFFGAVEAALRVLGEEGALIQQQVDKIMQDQKEPLHEFLSMAAYCDDKYSQQMIEQVEADLGERGERLGVKACLKNSYMQDFLDDLKMAYSLKKEKHSKKEKETALKRWDLVRFLLKLQKKDAGSPACRLLPFRLAIAKAKKEQELEYRDWLQMRCTGLLNQYADDEEFGRNLRERAVDLLTKAAKQAAEHERIHEILDILRTAVSWECCVQPIEDIAGRTIVKLIENACKCRCWREEPTSRFIELSQVGYTIIQVSRGSTGTPQDLCDLTPHLRSMASTVLNQVVRLVDKDPESMPKSVTQVVELRAKLPDHALQQHFDEHFWELFKPEHEKESKKSTRITEWAIAYCEQLKVEIPSWMMNKDQVEARNRLATAMSSNVAQSIREAVVFARQTDISKNAELNELFDKAVENLREQNRLPAGWAVAELVSGQGVPGFIQVGMISEEVKALFQRALTETKQDIVTCDRVGTMPFGFKVEEITSVQNEECWLSYMKRLDMVSEECKRYPGAAPCPDDAWQNSMGGKIETFASSQAILRAAQLPELQLSANEFLLFHGTNPQAAESIALKNFDMGKVCKNGLFGAGLYFAESSSKADEYTKPDANDRHPLIVCRVSLGHVNYCDRKDPHKNPGRDALQASCMGGGYHSVLGDRRKVKGTYREFVVYHPHQVYPHFIVWYRRI